MRVSEGRRYVALVKEMDLDNISRILLKHLKKLNTGIFMHSQKRKVIQVGDR